MDVRFSPEQMALRDAAAQAVDRLGPGAVGALDDGERAAKLDAALGASGWRELRVADEGDTPLASVVEVAIVAEELGRGLADTPFLGPTLAAELRRLAGAAPATRAETVAFVSGLGEPASLDLGATEGSGGTDGLAHPGEAVQAVLAVDARGCDDALVLVGAPDGVRLATVGVPAPPLEATDGPAPLGDPVDLTRMTVPIPAPRPELLEGARPLTDADRVRWTALGLAVTSADLVGVMRGAVRLSCDYAAIREQFGVAIGSFQAVQHLLADAHVAAEGSHSVALHAAWAVDALPSDEALAAGAVAKAYCSRAARAVCETAIQVHGGIGNTWECLAHVFLRRALLSIDLFGGVGANLERVLAHRGVPTGGHRGFR